MQKLVEFYEMVSLNDASLEGSEREAILKAGVALRMFERSMESFKTGSIDLGETAEALLGLAA